ncbi:MAG: bifunctional oligoribonuclease/PAP phosphatase NrnA [Acidobacteriaceae bacterium]
MKPTAALIEPLLQAFRSTPRFLLSSHARPDGDAIGSVLALAGILEQMGCEVDVVLADPVPLIYRSLPGVERIRQASTVPPEIPCILLECDGVDRTGIAGLSGRMLINIDHHASGRPFGSLNWIDPQACAVGAMIYLIAQASGAKITPAIATCLYTAILSDTGSFTYNGTDAATFALARDLTVSGAHPGQIARDIYFSSPESKIRLLGAALSRMRREGPIAWTWVTLQDLHDASAEVEDCEGVINYLIGVSGVEAAVFLREVADSDRYRLSIRSKGALDVAKVAEHFGGGGHRTASGCTIEGPLEDAADRIVAQLRQALC